MSKRYPSKLPHFVHVFPSFGVGGVPLRMVRVMNYLGCACHHTVISLDGNFDAAARLASGAQVELHSVAASKDTLLSAVIASQRALRQLRPDLLLTYNWGAIEWALANRLRPLTRHVHLEAGFGVEEATTQLRRRVLMRRWALTRCEALAVPSLTLKTLAETKWLIPKQKIRYIPNGIDVGKFETARTTREAGPVVIGTVAPLRPEKNLSRLLEAVRCLNQSGSWKLVIAGEGMERPRLEALAATLPDPSRVVFLGHVSQPAQLLTQFDIFAMSSDTEQMPNSLLEAMAAGLPVAATDVGDIRHMVSPENLPFIVPSNPPRKLAEALSLLIKDAACRNSLGNLNLQRVAQYFSETSMMANYKNLLLPA